MQPRKGFVSIDGLRIHYREWGDPALPDVLLVHGWATSSLLWHDVAEALSADSHLVAPDNRGNGESDVPESGYELARYAADVLDLSESLGLQRPAFVGNSWGANIGTYLAAEHPAAFGRFLLEDPVYRKMEDAFATVVPDVLARRERAEADLRADAEARGLQGDALERDVYLATHFLPHALEQVSTVNRSWALECDAFLARIAAPTLVLVADEHAGGYISADDLEHHRAAAADMVEFRLWKGVGHLMHAEQPERFLEELRRFLAQT